MIWAKRLVQLLLLTEAFRLCSKIRACWGTLHVPVFARIQTRHFILVNVVMMVAMGLVFGRSLLKMLHGPLVEGGVADVHPIEWLRLLNSMLCWWCYLFFLLVSAESAHLLGALVLCVPLNSG